MATSLAVADLGKRLLEASRKGNAEEVRQLMATGAPITTDWLGTSPLHLAAQYGHTVTAEVLLRAGVSRDGKTKVEKTPLHLAAQHGHMEIAQMLVKCGATIHAVDMLNMTPLHWAVEAHSPVICKLLMEQGARIDIRNKFGKTPVDIVRYKGFIDLLEILLSSDFAQQENGTKRLSKNEDSLFIESKKRARTRKFPMTAGSWTVGEMQSAEKEERLKPKEPRLTSPNEIQSKQSMMGDSKSEAEAANNLSSLVDAAAMVRSKVQSLNGNSKRITTSAASEAPRKRPTIVTEASVLDTLATLATASTQMATSGSETSLQAQKVVSLPSTAVAPSYISIPGVQGPVQVVHAGANQPGFIHPGSLASGLPAGMIQLASPLAFNFLPGGRFQIGQPVVPGHPLGVPFQMPLQHTGIPGSHLVAVSNAQGQNVTFIGGLPPGQMAPRLANATDTTPSRPGVVTSPVSQGLAPVLTTNSIPTTLPINIGHHSTLASPQQLPSSTTAATYQSEARHGLSKASPATLAGIPHGIMSPPQPGITQQQLTPTQLASAIPYANIGPGLAPIPLVPVAGLGGIQLVPQALLPTQVLSAIRAGSPSSPHLQPQFVAPGGAYTFPMSPLNLSSILPTALSLSQLPVAQHGINTLAQQHMGTSLSQQAIANILTQQEAGALQTTLANAQQRLIIAGSQPNIKATHQSLVLGGAQTDSPSKPAQRGPVAEADVSTLSHDQRVIFSGAHVQQILAAQQAIAVQNALNAHSAAGAQQAQGAQETTKQDQPPQGLIQQIYNAQARLQQDAPTVYQNVGAHHAVGTSNSSQQTAVSVAQIALSADQIMQPHFVNVANSQSVVAAMQKYQQTTPKSVPRTEQEATKEQPSIISQLTIATVEGKSPSSLMVTSAHSPRMPISPSNLMQKDDEMQGISPSRISPTKLRDSVSDAATEHTTAVNDHVNAGSDHVDAANDQMIRKLAATMGIPANSTNDIPPGSTVLSSNQALPHLQQLIYKQLQQQLQVQQQSGTPQPTKSPSPHQNETIKDEPISQSSMPSSPRQQQSPSHEFEDRTETQATTQSEYFWRVIEQENPDLKRQFAESELETELYSQDFSKQDEKPEERKVDDLLVKDENKERTPSPPTVSGVSDNEQRE